MKTSVGNPFRVGLFCLAVAAFSAVTASADPFAYMATGGGDFGIVNLQTGDYTHLGNSGQTLWGLGIANGSLFATDYEAEAGALYTVDPSNGHITQVVGEEGAGAGLHYWVFGSTTSGGLYGIDDNFDLYSINSVTRQATKVGATGLAAWGDWSNLSSGSDTLYLANDTTLYTVNTSSGLAKTVGDSGGPYVGGLAYVNGTLYGGVNPHSECGDCGEPPCEGVGCDNPCSDCQPGSDTFADDLLSIVTYNTTSGLATYQAAVLGINEPFMAMAPTDLGSVATPEPATGWLLGGTIIALLFGFRRKATT